MPNAYKISWQNSDTQTISSKSATGKEKCPHARNHVSREHPRTACKNYFDIVPLPEATGDENFKDFEENSIHGFQHWLKHESAYTQIQGTKTIKSGNRSSWFTPRSPSLDYTWTLLLVRFLSSKYERISMDVWGVDYLDFDSLLFWWWTNGAISYVRGEHFRGFWGWD